MTMVPYSIRGDDEEYNDLFGAKVPASIREAAERMTVEEDNEDYEYEDDYMDYSEVMDKDVFLGEVPYDTIIECIKEQFDDYINIEDNRDYVDVFYTQLDDSFRSVINDEDEYHKNNVISVLEKLRDQFVDTMIELFDRRLTIHIPEDDEADPEETEHILRTLYTFFILGAHDNFKYVIAKDMSKKLDNTVDDKTYYENIDDLLERYSPLVTCMGPDKFIEYRNTHEEVKQLFDDGLVSGNFLRKYSPKLYQNEEFKVEIINYIIMIQNFKEDVING